MGLQDGTFGDYAVLHVVLCAVFGILGVCSNWFIISYYARKAKLDQLSILYGSTSILSMILSLLIFISFIFFLIPGQYYPYIDSDDCQSSADLFFSGALKVLFMVAYRSIIFLLLTLIFLTACKVKWKIFKIKTTLLKHLITFFPVCLFALVCINAFVELECSTPFYIPWLGTNSTMTIIYFWILLVVPAIVSLCCLMFLIHIILFAPSSLHVEEKNDPRSNLDTIAEEIEGAGNKIKRTFTNVKETVSSSTNNIASKFDGREVTKRTIFTILILTLTSYIAIATSCIPALKSIYSDNNILGYDVHHTTADFNGIFVCSEIVPAFIFGILNPMILMCRVNGLRRYLVKTKEAICGTCKANLAKEPVDT